MTIWNVWLATAAVAALCVAGVRSPVAQSDAEMSSISGPQDAPRRHFRLKHAQDVGPERAADIYGIVAQALERGYQRSGLPPLEGYRTWKRYNTAPYLSSTHGNHYVNNYANATASAYGRFEQAGKMPEGSIIAKDSFAVTTTGGILLGPMVLMEKMPPGFNAASGDWKYTLVQPDGEVLGETNGRNPEGVDYCIACHAAVEHQDHLFFLPQAYRVAD